ncbi:MAG TPA: hypothetical protein VIH03_08190 [Nitrososphaerales archaeon]
MKGYILYLAAFLLLLGCAGLEKTTYTKLEQAFVLESIRNYLPKDVSIQPAYTIYEGSKWACNYKTGTGDAICCRDTINYMGEWNYCLLVDEQQNGFAFIELGTSEFKRWSEGRQPLFRKVEEK